jgi:hypothetical protein
MTSSGKSQVPSAERSASARVFNFLPLDGGGNPPEAVKGGGETSPEVKDFVKSLNWVVVDYRRKPVWGQHERYDPSEGGILNFCLDFDRVSSTVHWTFGIEAV